MAQDIMKERTSKETKREKLLKIGLTENDISTLFFTERMVRRQGLKAAAADRARQQLLVSYTFGVEIECYNARPATIGSIASRHGMDFRHESYNHTDHIAYYKLVSDASIHGNDPLRMCFAHIGQHRAGLQQPQRVLRHTQRIGRKGEPLDRSARTRWRRHQRKAVLQRLRQLLLPRKRHQYIYGTEPTLRQHLLPVPARQRRRTDHRHHHCGRATFNGQPLLQNQQPRVGSPSHHRVPPASGQHQLREDSSVGAFLHQTRTLVCRQPTDRRRGHNRRHRVSDRRRKGILQEPFPSPCSPLTGAASARHGHQYHQHK